MYGLIFYLTFLLSSRVLVHVVLTNFYWSHTSSVALLIFMYAKEHVWTWFYDTLISAIEEDVGLKLVMDSGMKFQQKKLFRLEWPG